MIEPNSVIRFTDSEWNGNRFGRDENDVEWRSGMDTIYSGTIITISNSNTIPICSHGHMDRPIALSKDGEAIFAYYGDERMPIYFIAAIADKPSSFGTLINTGLGQSQTTLIKRSY